MLNSSRISKGEAGTFRAGEIEKDKAWVTSSEEGDLLARALSIPIRVVTVNQNDGYDRITDMLTFPDSNKETQRAGHSRRF